MSALAFIHRLEGGTRPGETPLLLPYGAGGDENDLIPLSRAVAPDAALLSPRGKVLEHGMPRLSYPERTIRSGPRRMPRGCERPLQRTARSRWTAPRISRCRATVEHQGVHAITKATPELVDPSTGRLVRASRKWSGT
jgi:hypothetical protein